MKLSIIIPFNRYIHYLYDCLESIKDQNLTDYEVLLVVDAIEDVKDKIHKYDLPITLIESGEATVGKKRNMGLNLAKGDYVYFLDSDDYVLPNCLNALIEEAKKSNHQVVAGKRMVSWFKKQVYETMSDETNIERNLKDKDHDRLEKVERKQEEHVYDNEPEQFKIDLLIRTRHALRNVSCLNLLIKRSLIEENHISFKEEFFWYTDAPFVVELLKYTNDVSFVEDALLVKRKHNDPINRPALSQIKDPDGRFDEFIEAHNYCLEISKDYPSIHYYINAKMANYFTSFFAKKVRRSEDDKWRTTRFDTMAKVLTHIEPELLKKSLYRRSLSKACMNHDLKKAQKIIAAHLAGVKAKKIFKNKNEMNKYLYRHKYKNEPIQKNLIMFETFRGASYADSPKYIYEYLAKNFPGQYEFVWVLNDTKTKLPYGGTVVKRMTRKYAYYLAVCKYFVFNTRQPLWYRKREGQVFLETWHGTPLKRLAFDQEEVTAASPTYKAQFYRQKQEWDYLIAPNAFSSEIFKSCFMYKDEGDTMLDTGYPRNDLLSDPHKEEIAKELKKKVGIPLDKKVILYAPTWRDDEYYGNGAYKFQLKLNLEQMRKELGDEYVIILRTHYYIADVLDLTGLDGFAFNLSKYDDITEIYLMSDILITDYSSVFFDFANLKRPMLFYTYDLDKYRDVLRGFYINMEEELPGPLVFTTDEVIDTIKHMDEITEKYADRYVTFYDKFCGWEDGHSSQRVVETVFEKN